MKLGEGVFVAVAAVWLAGAAYSQGPRWHSMSDTTGTNGPVHAGTVWDPDGPGPLSPMAVVGGEFTAAVDVVARNVAAWDGHRWHALGEGLPSQVRCLTVWSGELIAGGYFREAGGQPAEGLARWDGQAWHPILGLSTNPAVEAMTPLGEELVVAGGFTSAGGIAVNNIAAYGPTGWRGLDQGLTNPGNQYVTAVGVYNGELYAGGTGLRSGSTALGSLARWNGQQWEPTSVVSGTVSGIAASDGFLYVAGGNLGPPSPSYFVLRYDGVSWTGLGPQSQTFLGSPSRGIASYRNEVYVTGSFNEVESWFTSVGVAVVGRFGSHLPGGSVNFPARVAMVFGEELFAGGEFLRAGSHSAQYVARWNGEQWLPTGVGTNSNVLALAEYRGELVAGGVFRGIAGFPIDGIARWNGLSWRPLGDGLRPHSSVGVEPQVECLAIWRDQLLVAGGFRIPGREDLIRVATWNGVQWNAIEPLYQGQIDAVVPFGDQIFVSGQRPGPFTGSSHGPHLWNGHEWITTIEDNTRRIDAMFEFQGSILAGLSVTNEVVGVARWDGAAWQQMGSSLRYNSVTSLIKSFAEFKGQLYVAGGFQLRGAAPTPPLVRWNGEDWDPVEVPGATISVENLTEHDGRLLAVITQDMPAPLASRKGIYAWDGQSWEHIGSMTWGRGTASNASVQAMLSHDQSLHIGGGFTVIDDQIVSARIARYGLSACYADCDRSTGPGILDIFDFLCFGNRFAANDPYACDCDTSTGLGVCDIFDFLCFGNEFSAGCP